MQNQKRILKQRIQDIEKDHVNGNSEEDLDNYLKKRGLKI